MLDDGVFGTDNEFFGIAFLGVSHNAGGAAGVVRLICDLFQALGVDQKQCIGMSGFSSGYVIGFDTGVDGAAALNEMEVLLRNLLSQPTAQIAVRNEENVLLGQLFYDFQRGGGGDADIAFGFQRGGGVDVGYYGAVGILLLQCSQFLHSQLLCHGTASLRVGKQDFLFRREDLGGFRHESNAAHQKGVLLCFLRLLAQGKGIADKIRDFQNVLCLVSVCQDANVLFLFQTNDLFLQIRSVKHRRLHVVAHTFF